MDAFTSPAKALNANILVKHLFAFGKLLFSFVQADAVITAAIIRIRSLHAIIYPAAHRAFLKIVVFIKAMLPTYRAEDFLSHLRFLPIQADVYSNLPHRQA